MLNKESCKGKHLQTEERLIIEYGLDQNYSLKEIAKKFKRIQLQSLKRLKGIDSLK